MPRGDDAPDGDSGIEPLKREIYAIMSERADHWADTISLLLEHNERLSSRVDFSEHASVYEAINAALDELEREGRVESNEDWGGKFYRVK